MSLTKWNASTRYYLFSISNLIAAFGGGLILGKATNIIKTPYLHGGSILAFFIGSILGLLFMKVIPEKSSKIFAKSFSIGCSFVSLCLYYIYLNFSQDHNLSGFPALIFFSFLCVRFTLWFYSRVIRASESSGYQQSIAWVEFGYYAGMVLGLIFWDILNINVSIEIALLIDASFQLCAGIIDFYSFSSKKQSAVILPDTPNQPINTEQLTPYLCSQLSKAVVMLTVGVQVVIFNGAHYLSQTISTYLLATFYLGVAVSAFLCNRYKIFVSWNKNNSYSATLCSNRQNKSIKVPILYILAIIFISIFAVSYEIFTDMYVHENITTVLLVCTLTFIAAFAFETLSLSFLDKLNSSSLVMQTYGLMGFFSAVGFWTLTMFSNNLMLSIILISIPIIYITSQVIYPIKSLATNIYQ